MSLIRALGIVKCQLALVLLALRSCSQAGIVTGQCVACHGILGMGDGTNPRMAGQTRGYVLKTLQEFQSKVRGNNPWMSDILGPLHPDDLVALAAFMAGR